MTGSYYTKDHSPDLSCFRITLDCEHCFGQSLSIPVRSIVSTTGRHGLTNTHMLRKTLEWSGIELSPLNFGDA